MIDILIIGLELVFFLSILLGSAVAFSFILAKIAVDIMDNQKGGKQ